MFWFAGLGAVGLVTALATSLSLGRPPEAPPVSVVLITIDTLRADYVGSYGSAKVKTPTLDALSEDGIVFENAYCQVPLTPPSHASILTGTYPATHGLRDFTSGPLRPDLPTLATILQSHGYRTAAFVSAFVLDRSWGMARGFDIYHDHFDIADLQEVKPAEVERPADQTLDEVLPWLQAASDPFFLWLHLFDPHHDYTPPEPFRGLYSQDPYAGEVAWTDSQLARLMGVLKQQGRYDKTLIAVTSDHGEGLGDHREREHGFFLYEESIRIPLIIKLPARFAAESRRVTGIVQSIDILPTILQALDLPAPEGSRIEGRGRLSEMLGKRTSTGFAYAETRYPLTTFGWSPLTAYRQGDFKLVEAPRGELYDLSKDPRERTNLLSENSALAGRMRQELSRLQDTFSPPDQGAGPETDADTLEKLGALGYVAAAGPAPASGTLADPKDKVEIFEQVLAALQAAESGAWARSNSLLRQVAESNPDLFIAFYQLGNNYLEMKQPDRALEAYAEARRLNPGYVQIDLNAARAHQLKGDLPAAAELLQPLVKRRDAPLRALQQLASVYQRQGRPTDAETLWRQVLKRRPGDRQAAVSLGVSLVRRRAYDEGLGYLDQVHDGDSGRALVENFRGIALANLGRTTEAVQAYRKAIASNPRYPQPRLNLALTLLEMGQREEANREFRELCRLDSNLCERFKARFGR